MAAAAAALHCIVLNTHASEVLQKHNRLMWQSPDYIYGWFFQTEWLVSPYIQSNNTTQGWNHPFQQTGGHVSISTPYPFLLAYIKHFLYSNQIKGTKDWRRVACFFFFRQSISIRLWILVVCCDENIWYFNATTMWWFIQRCIKCFHDIFQYFSMRCYWVHSPIYFRADSFSVTIVLLCGWSWHFNGVIKKDVARGTSPYR